VRHKKIRGFKRRFRDIEIWRLGNLDLRLDLIEKYNREYAEIIVHPWCDISIINSKIPEPKRTIKKLMLSGLIDIYESWKVQLDKLGKPYYLKIWLFEQRFSNSQVVCAVADKIDFYENNFFKPDVKKLFKPNKYGQLRERLQKFDWEYRFDEDHYDNIFIGEPDLYASRQDYDDSIIWFNRLLKKPHRLIKFDEPIGEATESYSFKRGDLWIGGQK
jgi:hypothetical protein